MRRCAVTILPGVVHLLWARREKINLSLARSVHDTTFLSDQGHTESAVAGALPFPLSRRRACTPVCLFVLCVQVERRSPADAERAIVCYLTYFPQVLRAPAGDLPVEVVPWVSLPTVLQYACRVDHGRQAPFHRDDTDLQRRFEDLYWPMSQARLRRLNRWRQHKALTLRSQTDTLGARAPRLAANVDNSDCEGYHSDSKILSSERRVARAVGPFPVYDQLEDKLDLTSDEEQPPVYRRLRRPVS